MKPKSIIIIVIIAMLIVIVFAAYKNQGSEFKISKVHKKVTSNQVPISSYSFVDDSDLDGLSDAKEFIYGTDPNNPDTDGDIYPDGTEVERGYDPAMAGPDKLNDREKLSLTIKYFNWFTEKTDQKDPQINEKELDLFLQERNLLQFTLPIILDSEINFTNNDKDKIATYLKQTQALNINEGGPYLELAKTLLNSKQDAKNNKQLNSTLLLIEENKKTLQNISVPSNASKVHKLYLGVFITLESIFKELYNIKTDPVAVMWRARQGKWLAGQVADIERLRQVLLSN